MTRCLVVGDDAALAKEIAEGLAALGVSTLGVGPAEPFDAKATAVPVGFDEADATVRRAAESGGLDALVVVHGLDPVRAAEGADWERVLAEHETVEEHVLAHAAWSRAAMRYAKSTRRPFRAVHVTAVRQASTDSAAQAIAQLVRSAQDTATDTQFDAFSISYEGSEPGDRRALGQLAARLVWGEDALELAGAELAVGRGWAGLRRHPGPVATVSYGGPAIPDWVHSAIREVVQRTAL